jgi:hypothetical protein
LVASRSDVLDILRQYPEKWFSIDDLVKLTGFSDKSVRERVRELEINEVLEISTATRGTRLFRLRDQYRTLPGTESDSSDSTQTLLSVREHRVLPPTGPIEIGAGPVPELHPLPFVGVMRDLHKNRDAVRKILLDVDRSELEQLYWLLRKTREKDKKANPFEAVTIIPTRGLIEGVTKQKGYDGFLIGTASASRDSIIGLHFGRVHLPVKIPIITASGVIQRFLNDRPIKKSDVLNLPERLHPTSIDRTEFRRDLAGLPKILRQTYHYELDEQLIADVVEYLQDSRQYEADEKTIEMAARMRSDPENVIFLRRGALTPGEQHPYDFMDPEKALFVGRAFDEYVRVKDRLHDNKFNGFGVISQGEPRRAIFREIIDEILGDKLPDWQKGQMNALSDNDLLAFLLEEGEYTAILKKTPMEDVLSRMDKGRLRRNLGGAVYSHYEEQRQKMKTYQFFLGSGQRRAVRYDYPVYHDYPQEAISMRESCLPYLIHKSSPEGEFEAIFPRILKFAYDATQNRAAEIDKLLPSWFGGKKL